ncbi:2-C-methyl-D-erythritol 4-phosphate cytidylyltransferase [Denitrovibrio acetiphilus DSM 12809]|uniref:2-C-methyl-D-erythritol 4-phosphate cytidylyltransferase n=1 Tax=Denitrovibrio acetiphilus (strain DSM 12809 / NBRC 114555 / N2460) TaxID=522772 RepID=D4H7Y4_DENA2|nr:2-C-methyl-D-erythritol 4-phosphate cytidylyltransferase [Denitrovibrio acetiphilus]ADD68133.1 2-C-methyl-D-erythritol 4-phosphate cytidylyltransferase [Denitrovibrio acetiphilus DSM 12809]
MSVTAVIPAAGIGKRFASDVKKQFFAIFDNTVLYYTLTALNRAYPFQEFILGASPSDYEYIEHQLAMVGIENYRIVQGGSERFETVYNCIKVVRSDSVLIHDAVRPFITTELVHSVIDASLKTGSSICGLKVRDTLKKINGETVEGTVNRDEYILSHTPQVFRTSTLIKAVENASEFDIAVTDEAQAIELFRKKVAWVPSTPDNIKLTYTEDIAIAESLVQKYFG